MQVALCLGEPRNCSHEVEGTKDQGRRAPAWGLADRPACPADLHRTGDAPLFSQKMHLLILGTESGFAHEDGEA